VAAQKIAQRFLLLRKKLRNGFFSCAKNCATIFLVAQKFARLIRNLRNIEIGQKWKPELTSGQVDVESLTERPRNDCNAQK